MPGISLFAAKFNPETLRKITAGGARKEKASPHKLSTDLGTYSARLILMLADGIPYVRIQAALGCNPSYVSRWKSRIEQDGVAGLHPRYRVPEATVMTPRLEARILNATRKWPVNGATQWSTRSLARHLCSTGRSSGSRPPAC
jgi:hypothetical protein